MVEINIPGYKNLKLSNIVFDFNGTLAKDGILIKDVKEKIIELKNSGFIIYIVTADTYGSVKAQCEELPVEIKVFNKDNASLDKERIVENIGGNETVTIGNGRNDIKMFRSSELSIAVIESEGVSSKAAFEADIIVCNIIHAMELLLKPNRIKATLRN